VAAAVGAIASACDQFTLLELIEKSDDVARI